MERDVFGLTPFQTVRLTPRFTQLSGVNVIILQDGENLSAISLQLLHSVDIVLSSDGRVLKSRWDNVFTGISIL